MQLLTKENGLNKMELEIIISVIITTIALLIIALITAVVFLNKRMNRLNETLIDVDLRIDPIRLNFLWGLRTALYQQEKYESISDVNEIIEDEFGKEAVNHISHDDFLNMI